MLDVGPDLYLGYLICNYSSVAALSFTIYDILLTLDDTKEQILVGEWTTVKALYIALQVGSVVFQVFPAVVYLSLAKGVIGGPPIICRTLLGFQAAAAQVAVMGIQMVLLLRLQALYSNKPRLLTILRYIFATEVVIMVAVQIYTIPRIIIGELCTAISFPAATIGFLLPPILFECLLFVLGIAKFYEAIKAGWGQGSVIRRFLSDGVWAFILPFVCHITNTLCLVLIQGSLSGVAYSWVVPVSCFAGYRLIISMSQLLRKSSAGQGVHSARPDGAADTQLELSRNIVTADFEMDDILSSKSDSLSVA